jgi:amino acid transporter
MSKKFDWAIILSFAIAWLYLMGMAFNQSYFRELGLSGHNLQHAFEEVLFDGFGALFLVGVTWAVRLAALLEIVIFLLMIWGGLKASRRIRARIRGARIRAARNSANNLGQKIHDGMDQALNRWVRFFLPLIAVIAVYFVALFSIYLSDYQGRAPAKEFVEKARKYDSASHIVGLTNGKKINLGPLVGCDDQICIYMASDRAVVIKRDIINAELLLSR